MYNIQEDCKPQQHRGESLKSDIRLVYKELKDIRWELCGLLYCQEYRLALCGSGDCGGTGVKVLSTNRKVAGSIPDGVIGIFHFRSHYGPGVYSASNRNEYQEDFLEIKTAGA